MNNEAKIKNETYRSNTLEVKAGVIGQLLFNDTKPNSAFIRNYGSTDLYVSVRSNPSATDFDQVIASGSVQSVIKLQPYDRLYFKSAGDCKVFVESFTAENLKPTDIPETQQIVFINTAPITLGNIEKINQPLPAGSNVIGGVTLSGSPEVSDEAYTPVKITASAGGVTVKASAGKVVSVITTGTDVLLFDGATEVWKVIANNPSMMCPLKFNTSIIVKSASNSVCYVAYK